MSIEIIPAGASAVVTKDHHNYRDDCCRNGKSYDDGEVQIMRDVKDARQDLIASNFSNFVKLNDSVTQAASAASLGNSHSVEVMQNGFCQAAVANTAGFAAGAMSVADAKSSISDQVAACCCDMQGTVRDASKENLENQWRLASAAVRDSCDNQTATMLAFKDVQLQSAALAAQASKESALCCCEMKLQAERLEALQERLACQASKEAALCCCETKAAILAEGNATRALINDIERDRLRDGKAKADTAIASYFAAHCHPTAPVV